MIQTSHSERLIHDAEFTVQKALSAVAEIDRELFIQQHKHRDAMGTLHIKLFLALEEFKKATK